MHILFKLGGMQEASDDGYHCFDEGDNTVGWKSVVITVCPASIAQDPTCPICRGTMSWDRRYLTGCRHAFHKGCLAAWQQYSENAGCPLCRRSLAVEV